MGIRAQPVTDDLPQITGCIALVNARVVTEAGKEPLVQHVVLRDGLITAMGPQISIPPDAYKIKADSLYVYPAFIDACSYMGQKEPEAEGNRGGQQSGRDRPAFDSEGNVSLEEAGITPFKQVRAAFDPKDKSISDWRAQGFAITHAVPRGRMIPGMGAIVVLTGTSADQMLWKEDVSMYGQWTGAGGNYPSTVIGIMAKWRELYINASQNAAHQASYSSASLVPRPQYNHAHEALIPLVKKEIPLFFRAPKVKDISRALAMQQDLGMHMILTDAEEAWLLKNQIRANRIPLVLSLDLPEDKAVADKKDKTASETVDAKTMAANETTDEKVVAANEMAETDTMATDPEKEAFEKRRAQSLKEHRAQAGLLAKEKIPFAFGTLSGKTGDFSKNMQTMIEHGLDKNAALYALTVQPAKWLGIDKYCGTLEPGKMANLIITNKPLFEKESSVRYMIVEGNLYAYEIREKKKSSGKDAPAALKLLEGTWSYAVEMPDQKREGTFEFSQANGEITGTISSTEITSGNNKLENIILDGDKVSFEFDFDADGQLLVLEFDLTLNKESFEGTIYIDAFGTFPITGTRTTKPE
jgi:imidazolonepropionase-like amidohydrolase